MERRRVGRGRGFTLIELLVVMAIIAILASILFPVFARAMGKARSLVCTMNTKQIGMAVMMYAQDWKDTLPRDNAGTVNVGGQPVNPTWARVIQPYIHNTQIFVCPSKNVDGWLGEADADTLWGPGGYGVNEAYLFRSVGYPAVTLSQIRDYSGTIVLADRAAVHPIRLYAPLLAGGDNATPRCNVDPRHNDGANFLFTDGHVKWLPPVGEWSADDTWWDLN